MLQGTTVRELIGVSRATAYDPELMHKVVQASPEATECVRDVYASSALCVMHVRDACSEILSQVNLPKISDEYAGEIKHRYAPRRDRKMRQILSDEEYLQYEISKAQKEDHVDRILKFFETHPGAWNMEQRVALQRLMAARACAHEASTLSGLPGLSEHEPMKKVLDLYVDEDDITGVLLEIKDHGEDLFLWSTYSSPHRVMRSEPKQ